MAIISNSRPFKGLTDAVKISAGTDDGIMSSNPLPFDFYYNGLNIKQGIRFSGNTFAYLTPNQTIEELKINRRDAICKGLYREDHSDYVRFVWFGYSHYSTSNQTEANRLEWEVYFFKDTNVLEVVIGKTPRTSGSVDSFDTKGGNSFDGPFEAGYSYVFVGDGIGKKFESHPRSHYKKQDYLERDVAIIGEDGDEKRVYPTAIASNTLVEQEDGTYEKLSDVLKNLKGGGDYEFLPVKPNDYLTFIDKGQYGYSISIFSKTITPIYWEEDDTIRFINSSNSMAYYKMNRETGAITQIKAYNTTQERDALNRLKSLRTCTVVHERKLYAFSYVSFPTPKGMAVVEFDLDTGEILHSGFSTLYDYDRTYKGGVYSPINGCIYLVGTTYQSGSYLHYAVYDTRNKRMLLERNVQDSIGLMGNISMLTNYRNLTRIVFTEHVGNGDVKATVFGAFSGNTYQSCEITLTYSKAYLSNPTFRTVFSLSEFYDSSDGVHYDTGRNILSVIRGDTTSHAAKYDEYTVTDTSSSSDIANSKVSLLDKLPYRTIDDCEIVQTPYGLYLIGGMVWTGNTGMSHTKFMLYKNRVGKMSSPRLISQYDIETQSKRINPFISCPTKERPLVEDVGFQIFDTTLNSPMWWNGREWVAGMTGESEPPGLGEDGKDFHMYRADIHSTNGTMFRNGEIMTTLQARLYDFDKNITRELHPSQYKWSRISKDESSDVIWDNQHSEGSYEINITASDVRLRAVFYLDVVDENGLSLLDCQASTN